MVKRCLNCMKEFGVPQGQENSNCVCQHCGYVEGMPPKEIYHLHPGTKLRGRYIIGTVLGFGGYKVTYKAWDENLGTVVAVNEYYPIELAQRIPGECAVIIYEGQRKKEYFQGLSTFLDEAEMLILFRNSPNIAHANDFFEENNTAYIIRELLDGITLNWFLKQENGRIDCDTAVGILMPIMDALRQLHKEGIVHRDINPNNIILCSDGRIKLLVDFWTAGFFNGKNGVTRSIMRTPGFAPPELYQSKSKQGPWTDIYALSATFYRCLTGVLPDESLDRAVQDTLVAPAKLNSDIPEYISTAIMKGMELKYKNRFRSIDEMKKAFGTE